MQTAKQKLEKALAFSDAVSVGLLKMQLVLIGVAVIFTALGLIYGTK